MKRRKNGIVIGTILFVLVAVLVFFQSQFMAQDTGGHEDEPPPVETGNPNQPGHSPTADELQNQLSPGGGPNMAPMPGQPSGTGPTIGR